MISIPWTIRTHALLGREPSANFIGMAARALMHSSVWFGTLSFVLVTLATNANVQAQYYAGDAKLPSPYPSGQVHRLFPGDAPPGVIGSARLQRWGAVVGHYQGIAFRGPGSTQFSMPIDGVFQAPAPSPLCAGLLIGAVYRFKITNIPGHEGEELYPTVEVIDRTYPPESLAARFPIPVNLEIEDLEDALQGRLVTRVIYLEDPTNAVPLAETPESARTLDIPGSQDAVGVADTLGKPVAIVRIGSLTPPTSDVLMPQFFLGYPPWIPAQFQPKDIGHDGNVVPGTANVNQAPTAVKPASAMMRISDDPLETSGSPAPGSGPHP